MQTKQSIEEIQKELDELGNDSTSLQAKPLEDGEPKESADRVFEDNTGDSDLTKPLNIDKPKIEESKSQEENKPRITDEDAKKYYQQRAEKRANRIKTLEQEFTGVKQTLNDLVSLLKKGDTEQAKDKFELYAEKHNLDPQGIKELASIIKEEVNPQGKTEAKQEDQPEAEDFTEEFEAKWEEFMPEIEKDFPKANLSQVREAEKKLQEIYQSSPKFRNYDLVDIFNSPKFNQTFKDILFSGRKTFESGRATDKGSLEEKNPLDMEINSAQDALKVQEYLHKLTMEADKPKIISHR